MYFKKAALVGVVSSKYILPHSDLSNNNLICTYLCAALGGNWKKSM